MGSAASAGWSAFAKHADKNELQSTLADLIEADRNKLQDALDEVAGIVKPAEEEIPKKLLDHYNVGDLLGEGSFGVVYACSPLKGDTSIICAVKMVDKVEAPLDEILKEVEFMRKLNHPNVIKCHDVFYEKCFVCIVMDKYRSDLVTGMQAHWSSKGKIPFQITSVLTAQMSASVHYIHDRAIIHRDIKGDNYLISHEDISHPECKVVIIDFGTAKDVKPEQRLNRVCGTKLYWSPEFFKLDYSFKVDIWAVGVVLYGLLCGRFPFRNEEEVANKSLQFSKGIPGPFKDLVRGMLEKKDEKRFSAKEVTSHATIAGLVPKFEEEAGAKDEEETGQAENLHREGGADQGQVERRRELLERIVNAAADEAADTKDSEGKRLSAVLIEEEKLWQKSFMVPDPRDAKFNFAYEWRPVGDKTNDEGDSGKQGEEVPLPCTVRKGIVQEAAVTAIAKTLQDFGIDTKVFGKGKAKTLQQLAAEVESGASVMMLDATSHKKLVRVVEMVALRILAPCPAGGGPGAETKYLIEIREKYSDGRERAIRRLPGAKKLPHENIKQVVQRFVADYFSHLNDCVIDFDYGSTQSFEEEKVSPSYPGIRTVYRKMIVQGTVQLKGGVAGDRFANNYEFSHEDMSQTTKYFKWMKQTLCKSQGIQYERPKDWTYSALVAAPVGMKQAELLSFLESNKIDTSKFGTGAARSLQDFSAELLRGECQLVQDPEKGVIVRVVEPVLVKLINGKDGKMLVQAQHLGPDGKMVEMNRLVGTKRRPDENTFYCARRILTKYLRLDPNKVTFETKDIKVVEEETESPNYPGMRTLYQKRIVTATLDP